MKLKNIFPLILLGLLLGFQSNEGNSILIRKVTNLKTGTYTDYTYDASGRVLTVVNSKGPTLTYNYFGDFVSQQFSNPTSGEIKKDTFYLSNSRAITLSGNTYGYQKIEYDGKGRFSNSSMFVDGNVASTSRFVWDGDNQKSYLAYDEHGKLINRVEYSYYSDKVNIISEKEIGKEHLGQHSKNLLKHSLGIMYQLNNADTAELNYYYRLNPNGTISLKTVYDKAGKLIDSLAYTY